MESIVCEQPNHFALKSGSIPTISANEVLLKIKRVGICGTDLHAFKGNQPYFTYPRILGHELAGEIVELGDESAGFSVGDQVTVVPYLECGKCIACRSGKPNCCTNIHVMGVHVDGGMREYFSVPIDHLVKTNNITIDQSAIVEPLSIGAHAVNRAEVKKDEYVLVIGAGPIGLAVMKFAKSKGATVIAMDVNERRLEFCSNWAPADYTVSVLDHPAGGLEDITNGEYPTTVIDATGNQQSMEQSFQYVSHGGNLVYVGLVKKDITFNHPEFHKREMTVMGSRNAMKEDFQYVINCIEAGLVDTDSYINGLYPFNEDIENVFEHCLNPDNEVIKAVVKL